MYFRIGSKLLLDWNADDKFTALLSENILNAGEEEGHIKVVTLKFCLTDCSEIQTPAPDLQEPCTPLRLDCLKLNADSGLWDEGFIRNGKQKKRKGEI